MRQCPRCIRGRLWDEDGRLSCLLCSFVDSDPITTLDVVRSNLMRSGSAHQHLPRGERMAIDIAAVLERARDWGKR